MHSYLTKDRFAINRPRRRTGTEPAYWPSTFCTSGC
jgi:hypothetical protein